MHVGAFSSSSVLLPSFWVLGRFMLVFSLLFVWFVPTCLGVDCLCDEVLVRFVALAGCGDVLGIGLGSVLWRREEEATVFLAKLGVSIGEAELLFPPVDSVVPPVCVLCLGKLLVTERQILLLSSGFGLGRFRTGLAAGFLRESLRFAMLLDEFAKAAVSFVGFCSATG